MKELDYEQDLFIEPDSLDTEWLAQPGLVIKYARLCAQSEKELDEAKEKLDLVKATLDNAIRKNPDAYKLDKITETVVQNTILMQEDYKEAMELFLQAKYDTKVIQGAMRATDHRKSALENLVRLNGQAYFAGPSIPRDLSYEWQQKQKQTNVDTKIGTKLKRNK